MHQDGKCIHYFEDLDNTELMLRQEELHILQIIVFCNQYHHITSHHGSQTPPELTITVGVGRYF